MIKLFLIAGFIGVALCKPGYYKENEDFQYQRSSTDEGTKGGFYAAQRGNTGGNYEKAHNMDAVAQNQMGDIIDKIGTQIDMKKAETAAKGRVYGASSTMGSYNNGGFTSNNLGGRNFQEGTRIENEGQSSRYSAQNSRYGALNQGSQFSGAYGSGDAVTASRGYQSHDKYDSAYQSHSQGYQSSHSQANQDVENFGHYDANRQMQRIRPIKVVARPATPVAIPFTSQAYEKHASAYDEHLEQQHNANFELERQRNMEALSHVVNNEQVINERNRYPSKGALDFGQGKSKNYESSYSYKKEWEKHDENAIPVSTPNPYEVVSGAVKNYDFNAHEQQSDRISSGRYVVPVVPVTPNVHYKGYESSSQYKKEWEKHSAVDDTGFLSSVTPNPLSIDVVQSHLDAQNLHNDKYVSTHLQPVPIVPYTGPSHSKGYESSYGHKKQWENKGTFGNAGSDVVTSDSELSDLNKQRLTSYGTKSHAYGDQFSSQNSRYTATNNQLNSGNTGSLYDNSHVEPYSGTKPKDFHSSYSYHKSWERQGDPYVIKPAVPPSDFATQRNGPYTSQKLEDCDDEQQRLTRSIRSISKTDSDSRESDEELGQYIQKSWDQEDIGQQIQNSWDESYLHTNRKPIGSRNKVVGVSNWESTYAGQHEYNVGQQTEELSSRNKVVGVPNREPIYSGHHEHNFGQQTENLSNGNKIVGVSNWEPTYVGQHEQNFGQQTEDLGRSNVHYGFNEGHSVNRYHKHLDNNQQSKDENSLPYGSRGIDTSDTNKLEQRGDLENTNNLDKTAFTTERSKNNREYEDNLTKLLSNIHKSNSISHQSSTEYPSISHTRNEKTPAEIESLSQVKPEFTTATNANNNKQKGIEQYAQREDITDDRTVRLDQNSHIMNQQVNSLSMHANTLNRDAYETQQGQLTLSHDNNYQGNNFKEVDTFHQSNGLSHSSGLLKPTYKANQPSELQENTQDYGQETVSLDNQSQYEGQQTVPLGHESLTQNQAQVTLRNHKPDNYRISQQYAQGADNFDILTQQEVENTGQQTISLEQRLEKENLEILNSTTEKPGFWKGVGNSFTNAKDKVVSWFHKD